MTRAMAVELSPRSIRVNCIVPGFIATAMSGGAMDKDLRRKQNARPEMLNFAKPDSLKNLFLKFLFS